jgi:hypothetical protein
MWEGRAQSRRRCGRGEPSPGADVAGSSKRSSALSCRATRSTTRRSHVPQPSRRAHTDTRTHRLTQSPAPRRCVCMRVRRGTSSPLSARAAAHAPSSSCARHPTRHGIPRGMVTRPVTRSGTDAGVWHCRAYVPACKRALTPRECCACAEACGDAHTHQPWRGVGDSDAGGGS